MNTTFLFIGGPEIIIIGLIVVMLFGADKIPEIARGLGKGMRQLKDATNDIKKEINETADKQGVDLNIAKDVTTEINKVKDEITGPIKRNL
jgi:sec-independent protein translocase protein TatA